MQKTIFLLFPIAVLFLTACSSKTDNRNDSVIHNVFVTTPINDGGESVVTLPATVEEGRTISVGFKTAGQIEKIFVKEGSHVAKGQLIAELDSKDYNLGVSMLREKYASLKAETERQTKLHASGNMSDNDYEKAVSGLNQLQIQLQLEENKLGYCRLYSPSAGIVTKVNFENSEMVDAGTPVIELMDNSSLEAIVDLPLRIYSHREYFTSFTAQSSLTPGKEIDLSLLSITPRADNTQLYRMRLGIPSGSGLTPGMNVTIKIYSMDNANHNVEVPLSSVFEKNGNKYVWVVNPTDSVIRAQEITITGTGANGLVTVTDGLTGHDVIVRAGVRHLTDGEKVHIISESSHSNPGNIL